MTAPKTAPVDTPAPGAFLLPVNSIAAAADNVRRDVGDVTDLVASIVAHGVIEPVVVTAHPDPTGPIRWLLVAGHRRHTAAVAAELDLIPAVVRDDVDDVTRVEMMLIENLHRVDISPVEEAVALRRLTGELGVTQRALAKRIGRSQAHISKRLSILQLPDDVLAQVGATDGLTVGDAIELTKIADDPDQVRALASRDDSQHIDVRDMVDLELKNRERIRKRTLVLEELAKEDGLNVIDAPDAHGVWSIGGSVGRGGVTALGKGWQEVDVPKGRHAKQACHAAAVLRNGDVVYVCTKPSNHAKAGEKGAKLTAEQKAERARTLEVNKQVRAIAERREAFLRDLIATKAKDRKVIDHVARTIPIIQGFDDLDVSRIAVALLDLDEPDEGQRRWNWEADAVRAYALADPDNELRAALALVLAVGEDHPRSVSGPTSGTWARDEVDRHFAFLTDHGYELDPLERDLLFLPPGDGDPTDVGEDAA
jgi:ParB/RepB/Spo0J family partition protein